MCVNGCASCRKTGGEAALALLVARRYMAAGEGPDTICYLLSVTPYRVRRAGGDA